MKNNLLIPDSAKKNFVFQFFYQMVILVLPLVISPYLTRTLGSTSLGVYTYTYSIAYYFVIFAMLGINKHGQRIIAQRRNDITALRKSFWSLYFVHFLTSVLSLVCYLFYVILLCGSNVNIALIQAIYVFSATLDITWLFYGLEKFKIVAIRNAIIKILESLLILCLVKSPSDTGIYTAIMCLSVCLGQVVMMPQVISAIPPIRFSFADAREHLKPMLTLFVAVVASTLYTMFDKTLLGIMSTADNVAFYEYSDKIVRIPRTFIGIIGNVLFPKACRYAAEKNFKAMRKNFNTCLMVTSFIGFAAFFGLSAVAEEFATIYYGQDFAVCGEIMIAMCPLILIIGIGETVRCTYIYPLKKDSAMVKILMVNAVANIITSALLIPVIGVYGAVAGTIVAEIIGLVAEVWICRKYISFKDSLKTMIPYLLMGFIMFVVVKGVAQYICGSIIALLIQILVGAFVFCALFLLYAFAFDKELKNMIIGYLHKVVVKRIK